MHQCELSTFNREKYRGMCFRALSTERSWEQHLNSNKHLVYKSWFLNIISTKSKQVSLEKWLFPGLELRNNKISLEHLFMPEGMEGLKIDDGDIHIKECKSQLERLLTSQIWNNLSLRIMVTTNYNSMNKTGKQESRSPHWCKWINAEDQSSEQSWDFEIHYFYNFSFSIMSVIYDHLHRKRVDSTLC